LEEENQFLENKGKNWIYMLENTNFGKKGKEIPAFSRQLGCIWGN